MIEGNADIIYTAISGMLGFDGYVSQYTPGNKISGWKIISKLSNLNGHS